MRLTKKMTTLCAVCMLSTVALTGCASNNSDKNSTASATPAATETATTLKDGTYKKTATEPENGYTSTMTMTVENGKITSIDWDAADAEGNKKSELSINGKYVMTETGLTWAAQSNALAQHVINHQSVEGLTMNSEGRTDAVTGVSIVVKGFVEYATALMQEASK